MKLKLLFLFLGLTSCSSRYLEYEGDKNIFKNSDFEEKVVIKEEASSPEATKDVGPATSVTQPSESTPADSAADTKESTAPPPKPRKKLKLKTPPVKVSKAKRKGKGKGKAAAAVAAPVSAIRQPDIEDTAGFASGSRRPLVDPFHVGEVVTHSVKYFSAEAGRLTLSVKPFVEVNGKKSYNFVTELKTSSLFSRFYSVEDKVQTYVDYEQMIPHVFKLSVKETGQLRESQSFFDHEKLRANYWENKYTEKNGHEEKKQQWDILPFSQNAFSSIFYMRVFQWDVGKEHSFRVADDEKNITFKAMALSREKIDTEAGTFNALKLKATIASRGALEQVGDLYLWISDDERKYVLRIEAKIKIGTLVSEVVSIKPGSKE